VSEICQLRVEDILQIGGIWCMKFDPDAGSLKTRSSEKVVPLHPAVIEGGFLKFVAMLKSRPLFPKLPPDRFGKRGGNGTKVLGSNALLIRVLGVRGSNPFRRANDFNSFYKLELALRLRIDSSAGSEAWSAKS